MIIFYITNFIGRCLTILGFAFIWVKRRQKKGLETWEGKHGIIIKTWHIILCIVLGLLFIFVSRVIQNTIEFSRSSSGRETTVINDERSQDFADTDTAEKVVEHSEGPLSSEPATSSEPTVPTQNSNENIEQDKTENISNYKQYDLNVGDVTITLNLDPAWNLYLGDSFITGQPDTNTLISYADSYTSLGDITAIQEVVTSLKDIYETDVTVQTFAYKGDNAYVLEWHSYGEKFLRIFEPVPGARTYLKVEIEDRTEVQDTQTLIKTYANNF